MSPRAFARAKADTSASFSKSEPLDGAVHALEVLVEDAPAPDREVPDLRVPHLARREPDGLARGDERRVRVVVPQPVEGRRGGELDGIAGAGRRAAPSVEDDEDDERVAHAGEAAAIRCAAATMAANESTSSEAPPTSAPSTSGCESSSSAFSGFTEPP